MEIAGALLLIGFALSGGGPWLQGLFPDPPGCRWPGPEARRLEPGRLVGVEREATRADGERIPVKAMPATAVYNPCAKLQPPPRACSRVDRSSARSASRRTCSMRRARVSGFLASWIRYSSAYRFPLSSVAKKRGPRRLLQRAPQVIRRRRRALPVVGGLPRPSALACSTCRRPAGCIAPVSMSSVARRQLTFDHVLRGPRGVNRWSQKCRRACSPGYRSSRSRGPHRGHPRTTDRDAEAFFASFSHTPLNVVCCSVSHAAHASSEFKRENGQVLLNAHDASVRQRK